MPRDGLGGARRSACPEHRLRAGARHPAVRPAGGGPDGHAVGLIESRDREAARCGGARGLASPARATHAAASQALEPPWLGAALLRGGGAPEAVAPGTPGTGRRVAAASIRAAAPGTKSTGTISRPKNAPIASASPSVPWLWPPQRTIGAGDARSTTVRRRVDGRPCEGRRRTSGSGSRPGCRSTTWTWPHSATCSRASPGGSGPTVTGAAPSPAGRVERDGLGSKWRNVGCSRMATSRWPACELPLPVAAAVAEQPETELRDERGGRIRPGDGSSSRQASPRAVPGAWPRPCQPPGAPTG